MLRPRLCPSLAQLHNLFSLLFFLCSGVARAISGCPCVPSFVTSKAWPELWKLGILRNIQIQDAALATVCLPTLVCEARLRDVQCGSRSSKLLLAHCGGRCLASLSSCWTPGAGGYFRLTCRVVARFRMPSRRSGRCRCGLWQTSRLTCRSLFWPTLPGPRPSAGDRAGERSLAELNRRHGDTLLVSRVWNPEPVHRLHCFLLAVVKQRV